MLGISFDTFNLMHRFFGRIVVLEILCHTFAWVISKVESSGEASVWPAIKGSPMMFAGFISTIAAVTILLQTPSVIRHAFYETFLHLHIALIILVIVTLWMHLDLAQLPQLHLLKAVIAIWVIERTTRLVKILFRNVGRKGTKAIVEVLPGDAVRVTLDIARPWTFRPGQHIFLYMPSVGFWTSHPFSLAWSEEAENLSSEKGLAMNRQEVLEMRKTTMSLVCRRRTGFTDKLYKKAERAPDGKFMARAFVEGPYGGIHNLHSYGSVVLVAGGVGVTHHVPQVRDLVAGYANGTVAARRVVLVWVVQSPEHLEFIRPWMTTILGMEKRREILKILLFITRPRSTKEIHSPSATVQMFPGKPNFDTLLDLELDNQVGAMAVSVCGPGSLSDDVRKSVRRRQSVANIDFIEESFSW
jgi:predicted ferric reductase